jgi:hypothetical protein
MTIDRKRLSNSQQQKSHALSTLLLFCQQTSAWEIVQQNISPRNKIYHETWSNILVSKLMKPMVMLAYIFTARI